MLFSHYKLPQFWNLQYDLLHSFRSLSLPCHPQSCPAPCPESDAPSRGTYAGEGQKDAHSHQHRRRHSAALIDVADAVVCAVEAALVRLYRRLVQHHGGQHDCAEHTHKQMPQMPSHTRTYLRCCAAQNDIHCTFFLQSHLNRINLCF